MGFSSYCCSCCFFLFLLYICVLVFFFLLFLAVFVSSRGNIVASHTHKFAHTNCLYVLERQKSNGATCLLFHYKQFFMCFLRVYSFRYIFFCNFAHHKTSDSYSRVKSNSVLQIIYIETVGCFFFVVALLSLLVLLYCSS